MRCLPSSVQWHWVILTLACTTALLVQLGLVIRGYVAPTLTNTRVEQQDLKDMDFPLIFKICVDPGFDQTAIFEAGYRNTWEYFIGRNRFNSSIVGWAGHTNTSGVQGSVQEILSRIKQHSIRDVFEYIDILTMTGEWIRNKPDIVTGSVNYPHNCYMLDLANLTDVKEKKVNTLLIQFHNHSKYSLTIFVEGSTSSVSRTISANVFFSTGDTIKMQLGPAVT
jgi:hypothetical protein